MLSFLICFYASRSLDNDALLLFPLASYLLVSLPAASVLSGPSHVLAVVVWPILFLLLRPQLTFLDTILLVALLLLMSRSYETAPVVSQIFLCLLGARLVVDSPANRPRLLVAVAAAVVVFAIGSYWALSPHSETNRTNFVDGLFRPIRYHPMLLHCGGPLFLLALTQHRLRLRVLAVPAILIPGASLALPALGRAASAAVSFGMRVLMLSLLPIFLVGAIWFHFKRLKVSAKEWKLTGPRYARF